MEKEIKIISHRGNLNGPDPNLENTPEAVTQAIHLGFDVEIDVWSMNGYTHLGHDPDNLICYHGIESFFCKNSHRLWIHCKNIEALVVLSSFQELNVFGHCNDDYVLTSKCNIFCKPGTPANKSAIIVMPELAPIYNEQTLFECYGILTDYPIEIKEKRINRFIA
jgi:hypothetical protein